VREKYPVFPRTVDWGAIVAGFFVAFVLLVLLGLVAVMVGGTTVDPIIFAVITFVSLVCGGWVAGYLEPTNGILHGLMVAILTIIASIVIMAIGPSVASIFGLPTSFGADPVAAATTLFTHYVIKIIGGAVGGYLGQMTVRRPAARS
jgi:hypothetical protein